MLTRSVVLLSLVALGACGSSRPPDAVAPAAESTASDMNSQIDSAVRRHLARRSDLDLSAMELTVEDVQVDGDTAQVRVGFRVKDAPEAAMSMDYRLVKDGGEWVVQPNAPPPAPSPTQPGLPPGHPPTGGTQQTQPLPPGHPPVAQ